MTFVCDASDVLSGPCICAMNGWPHEFGPAGPGYRAGLLFCGNCECCVAEAAA